MRAERLLQALLLLQQEGRIKSRELARRLEVSVRTVQRDLEALEAAGIPLDTQPGPHGGVSLVEGHRNRAADLSSEEVEALGALPDPRALRDVGLGSSAEAALLKVAASLPAVLQLAAAEVGKRLHVDPAPWFRSPEPVPLLPQLQAAVWDDRRYHLRYRRGGILLERTVEPYALVVKIDRWYLVADSPAGMRVFRAVRVEGAEPLAETFRRREDFDIPAFWRQWCQSFEADLPSYPALLEVSDAGAQDLQEKGWRLEELNDDPPTMDRRRVRVDLQGPEVALQTVLALGAQGVVLEPAELRRAVARAAGALLASHRSGGDGKSGDS